MNTANVYQEEAIPSPLERFLARYYTNKRAILGSVSLSFLFIISVLSYWLTPYDPQFSSEYLLLPPSWDTQGKVEYFLGTDELGRDLLSRLIDGSRFTLFSAFIVTLFAALLGGSIGIIAGLSQGMLSSILHHFLDVLFSIPSLLLAILLLVFLDSHTMALLLAVGLALLPRFVRTLYTLVHNEIDKDYITASRLDGANNWYLLWHAIFPTILPEVVAELTLALSIALLDLTALAFLGLADPAQATSWGTLLGDGMEFMYLSPWLIILPGAIILFTVISINLVGSGIRHALALGVE